MKVVSFMRDGFDLVPIEIELGLSPGLPQITFLGLPDAAIRESVGRIKSALRHQGFEIPAARQVLVHLRPSHLRKSSRGLDLAVAAALLWETTQLPMPEGGPPRMYGELSLKGEVLRPDDLEDLPAEFGAMGVVTGPGERLGFPLFQIREIRGLASPDRLDPRPEDGPLERPGIPDIRLHPVAAETAAVIAAGEHSALLAGPPGTGKSTVADLIHALLPPPQPAAFAIARRLHRGAGERLAWRPLVRPHHSVTPLAMVGGGSPPAPGEATRAHSGLMILDELMEFAPAVQEMLREPLETGSVRLARAGRFQRYPARFVLVATTNLCPCGRYLPGRDELCRCARLRKANYLARLRGPFVDRFGILSYTPEWGEAFDVPVSEVRERVDRAVAHRSRTRGQAEPNARLSEDDARAGLTRFQLANLMPSGGFSRRRLAAILRVARTFADLDESEPIGNKHLDRAIELSFRTFKALERAEA